MRKMARTICSDRKAALVESLAIRRAYMCAEVAAEAAAHFSDIKDP